MSINVNVGNIIPTNVVEVGNEISADQLAAITAAVSPSAVNPFSTSIHTHVIGNITGLQTALDSKVGPVHTHTIADITGLQNTIDSKSSVGHVHGIGEITDLPAQLEGKANLTHTHTIANVTGLQTALDGKASSTHTHTGYALLTGATFSGEIEAPQIGNILNTDLVIDSYNDTGAGTHYYHKFTPFDGRFNLAPNGGGLVFPDATIQSTASYSKAQSDAHLVTVAGWVNTKADLGHTHVIADVTGLQTALNSKLTFPQSWIEGLDMGRTFTISSGVLNWDNGGSTISHPVTGSGAGTFVFNKKITCTPVSGVAGINIGIGGNSVDSTTAGDIYINTASATLGFRDALGNAKLVACLTNGNAFTAVQSIDVSTTTSALRVTQRGTGHAFVAEDSTTPDSSAVVITNNGAIGVGVDPYTGPFAGDASLVVQMNDKQRAASFRRTGSTTNNGQPVVWISGFNGTYDTTALQVVSGIVDFQDAPLRIGPFGNATKALIYNIQHPVIATGTYDREIAITLADGTYRIPCRQV